MKYTMTSIICFFLVISCNSEKKKTIIEETSKKLTIAEKIANAHGYENWKNVSEVKFTFKVDRDTIKGQGRSWVWRPKENKVSMSLGETQISYIRHEMDSTHIAADRGFINDKFWLLVPFQLVWDTSATISDPVVAKSPIKNEDLNMITLLYGSEGGYTPGDAYDIYYDENYMIKEWTFRQGNSEAPSLSNTFENYRNFNGIKIAIDHKKDEGKWNLNFADVSITLD
ncbi:MAG: hypothetical protein HRU49_01865 [Winogradskyella sp.]|uniref:hypothetical protein n=1 Tax=Winogradskyella sp. TaxID=1883156 RepID=UPI0025EA629B|nr:hypothetical protein [Winogradskyella sp.]NRB82515.1 hypothetical protein [Winogradskyella sp.]